MCGCRKCPYSPLPLWGSLEMSEGRPGSSKMEISKGCRIYLTYDWYKPCFDTWFLPCFEVLKKLEPSSIDQVLKTHLFGMEIPSGFTLQNQKSFSGVITTFFNIIIIFLPYNVLRSFYKKYMNASMKKLNFWCTGNDKCCFSALQSDEVNIYQSQVPEACFCSPSSL